MNTEKIGSIADIVGAIAIVISLVYVAIEIRQNTRVQTATTYYEMSRDVVTITSRVPNTVRVKLNDGEELSEVEWQEYLQWFGSTMRIYENWWKQHELGTVDDETFESYITHMHITLQNQRVRDHWANERLYSASPGFDEYVANYLSQNPVVR